MNYTTGKKYFTLICICTLFLSLISSSVFAEEIRFNSTSWSFTENNHKFQFSGSGGWIGNSGGSYSSPYHAYFMANYGGSFEITLDEATTMQLNNLYAKGPSWSISITVKGYNGSTEKYSQNLSLNSGYQQFSFSNWTGINKIKFINLKFKI